jgi:hypothetical protein
MNFKPTPWKSITSIISGFFINLVSYSLLGVGKIMCICPVAPAECNCPERSWIGFTFDPYWIVISIVAIILVYSIWSFVQKK